MFTLRSTSHSTARSLRKLSAVAVLSALSAILAPSAHAQAQLSFTGGNGSPLGITLLAPVTYTITTAPTFFAPLFVFDGVGNIFSGNSLSAGWTYSINGGAAQTLTNINSGFPAGAITTDDAFLGGTTMAFAAGDQITLNTASVFTTSNIAAPAPTNGLYQTFVADATGLALSGNGTVAVPEAGTGALVGTALPLLGLLGTTAFLKRHRKS